MPNKKVLSACRQAVVLLSGGLDSATALYFARARGYQCHCLVFDYGQRHRREIQAAQKLARKTGSTCQVIRIALPWKGSSLLESKRKLPKTRGSLKAGQIPDTYVPGRNIIFLSFAFSCAEARAAGAVFIGAHSQDYSGYPDCRPEFYRAFRKVISTGTKAGVQHKDIKILAPLLYKTKAEIIRLGSKLGVPFQATWSCYKGGRSPCGKCDSCYYRAKGFKEAGLKDR
ncbi:MAG: 7-cyano-7-deazaguanine synthase QueC [Candidatus Omnitrophica bacterium]|nr:7-cyano-7-deazaguanine synthase QueC [Candidatus Omnitrophota bacterium]MDD5662532.1 7-cyano-7-deazaguanine synthase QueC [Candidatus Omnitrophota bacterium]